MQQITNDIENTLNQLSIFFKNQNVDFWLEAGTALGVYRDREIMPWDHDMDIAIWFDQVPKIEKFISFFEPLGFKVVPQKNFPYLDNIIQLKTQDENNKYMDVDIYLYKEYGEYAYMRWINTPVGFLAKFKQKILYYMNAMISSKSRKWSLLRLFIPDYLNRKLFYIYLYIHIQTTDCIYHRFPKKFFKNLKSINFCNNDFKIAKDTEEYLEYRYGGGWSIKDKTFNQTGKWKKSKARVRLKMSHIPMPKLL